MGNIYKWILAGLGWAVYGPIGGLIGFLIGSTVGLIASGDDSSRTAPPRNHRGPYRNTGTQHDVNAALMVLIAAVMKSDGQVTRSELNYVKKFLLTNYGEERGKELLQLLGRLVKQDIPLGNVCQQIKVNTDYNTRYHMVDFLSLLAAADGLFHPADIGTLHYIAQQLGISAQDYTSIYERHVGSEDTHYSGNSSNTGTSSSYGKDPYKVLGISSSATDDEVRRAYRKMAMKYHPDRVAGMGEEIQRNAAEQMKEINLAYDIIKQRRSGLK